MLELDSSSAQFLRVRADGRLRREDYRRFVPEFDAEARRRPVPFPLLLDLRGFRGWTPAGLLHDLAFDLRNRRTFSRIAVIGDRRRHRFLTWLGVPLFTARMRYFESADSDRAQGWLVEERPSPTRR